MRKVERREQTSPLTRSATAYKIPLALALCTALGCESGSRPSPAARPDTTAEPRTSAAAESPAPAGVAKLGKYGAPLTNAPTATLGTVLGKPSEYTGHPVRIEGHVRRACSAMGCWLELAESTAADAPACRVLMKDHAFFVPTDSAGANARVEGTLDLRRIEPAQVAHMEGEGATFEHKAADGSAEEVRFVASGVELWRGS